MHLDHKLLRDLGPYMHAYGHMMSNFIYNYRFSVAAYKVLGGEDRLRRAQYHERVLVSFLVTKNITYSQNLVKKDMAISDDEIRKERVSSEESSRVMASMEADNTFYRNLEAEIRKEGSFKSDIEITVEWWELQQPSSTLPAALRRALAGNVQQAKMFLADAASFYLVLGKVKSGHADIFNISFWRFNEDTKRVSAKAWTMELYDATVAFPEIFDLEWKNNKA